MKKLMLMAAVAAGCACAHADTLTAQDYVQDGLIAHWDGIENAGYGQHDAQATIWKNLVAGGLDLTLQNGAQWVSCALQGNGKLVASNAATLDYQTIEIVFVNEKTGANAWLFSNGVSKYAVLASNRVQWNNNRGIRTFNFNTTGIHSLTWVNDKSAYIDGAATTYGDYSDTWGAGNSGVHLGARNSDSKYGFYGKYFAIRLYSRELTADEIASNQALDARRFGGAGFHTWVGASGGNWADASNWEVDGAAVTAVPGVTTLVSVASSTVAVNADAAAARLELSGTAKLSIASGCAVGAFVATRDGVAVPRGIYTGTGTGGTQVDWLEGDGVLRVAGGKSIVPTRFPTPAGEGWYEFGMASGGTNGYNGTSGTPHAGQHYIVGDHPIWDEYAFPVGAKLRLVGHILLETVPAGLFSEYDVSGTTRVYVNGTQAFADGTKFTIPSGCTFRCQPYKWELDASVADKWWCTAATSNPLTYTDDIENNGTHAIYGDGTQTARQIFSGNITGAGELYINGFGHQGRLTGGYDANFTVGGQNGCALWFDTTTITGGLVSATLHGCWVTGGNGKYGTNVSYCANAILFGKDNSAAIADHELAITTLTGNAGDTTDIPSGKRWRRGGHVIVWGDNTVHVGELKEGLHVVARRQDQDCNNYWLGSVICKGIGNLVIDTFTSGNLYPSTNINVKIGKVVAASKIDYTYQSGAINGMTLDITNTCNASAIVKATDIGMLPAQLSGFKGTVTLTDTATKSYTMPIDFTHGTNSLYNTTGCIGSGTLGSAPASGTIDATFPTTGDAPVKGEYALARFTSGGERLAGWTVTLNGQSVESTIAAGMEVTVKKDATGIWLDVRRPGVTIIIR